MAVLHPHPLPLLLACTAPLAPAQLPRLLATLDAANTSRVARFRRDADRWASALAARLALLAAARLQPGPLPPPPLEWIRAGPFDKPRVVFAPATGFGSNAAVVSVTHDGELVVCAAGPAQGARLGIDALSLVRAREVVMVGDTEDTGLRAAARRLSPDVAAALLRPLPAGGGDGGRALLFATHWTLLEAVAKAAGQSLFSASAAAAMAAARTTACGTEGVESRSVDAGADWSRLVHFVEVEALLQHPQCEAPLPPPLPPPQRMRLLARHEGGAGAQAWRAHTIEVGSFVVTVAELPLLNTLT